MSGAAPYLIAVAVIAVVFVLPAWIAFRREEREARAEIAAAVSAGRHEPLSIRPWVDLNKCMGSGACLLACPEHAVLQVVDGQAQLANASACVGHGACASACPRGAIELVFGGERRGVDIPQVGGDFETNVPGLYVAGELGGMGLIANAVEQGRQAARSAIRSAPRHDAPLDLLVVGAGPAGIAAAMEATQAGARVLVVEQGTFGGAIRHYPRQKIVMSRGFELPGRARIPSGTLTKSELIAIFSAAIEEGALQIEAGARVEATERVADGTFIVRTSRGERRAARVVLAVGRRGTPRTLGVAGEDLEKVTYRLLDPERYAHRHVLVVGGGDSAVEAAVSLGEQEGCRAILAYRGAALTRPKGANLARLEEAVAAGRVDLMLHTVVAEIGADRVHLRRGDETIVVANDAVIVLAGGVLPIGLLAASGIALERHFGRRVERLTQGEGAAAAPARPGRRTP